MTNCPKCQSLFNPQGKWGPKKFCSRSCANSRGPRTEEFKKQNRERALANPKGWALNPTNTNGSLAIKAKWDLLKSTITCKECSKVFEVPYSKRNRKYCSISCSNKNKYHQNSSRKHRSVYKGFQMDSGAERVFAEECDNLKIQWVKNTTQYFLFVDSNGIQRKYYPDFFLPEYDCWVEIKGRRYIRSDDNLRRDAVGKPVHLIISNQFKKDFNTFLNLLLTN